MMLGDASWQRPHRIEGAKPGRQDKDADEMEDEELIDEEEGLLEDEDLEDDTDESPTR